MEGQNKIMLYAMNGMFIILFNSFPAGLNLYYVVYNILRCDRKLFRNFWSSYKEADQTMNVADSVDSLSHEEIINDEKDLCHLARKRKQSSRLFKNTLMLVLKK